MAIDDNPVCDQCGGDACAQCWSCPECGPGGHVEGCEFEGTVEGVRYTPEQLDTIIAGGTTT